jgi:DNA polymerase-1
VMGRRRNIPEIASTRRDERARGERLAGNTQIQGSAADVLRAAQVNIDKLGLAERYDCHQILSVHDELVLECRTECVPDALEELTDLMEHPFPHDLPVHLAVDAGFGASWGASH